MDHSTSNSSPFSMPSPGEILRQQPRLPDKVQTVVRGENAVVHANPFRADTMVQALSERGVMLAPLILQWNYRVPAGKPFTKWLRTKELILSDARLSINDNTAGTHYFGTYLAQAPDDPTADATSKGNDGSVACQTLWGFSNEAAMMHMFELCRGNVKRVSIVETDLRDFVLGLKGHVRAAGIEHFSQSVLVASAAL